MVNASVVIQLLQHIGVVRIPPTALLLINKNQVLLHISHSHLMTKLKNDK